MNSTNKNHSASANPPRSSLRKISINTMIRIQTQIIYRKKASSDQKMFSSG